MVDTALSEEETRLLKTQIAIEYLIKLYINLLTARAFRVLRLRSFLLHVNAVRYDLDYLRATSGPLFELTDQMTTWRREWLDHAPDADEFQEALGAFFHVLAEFLDDAIAKDRFYLPERARYRAKRSIWLQSGDSLGFKHSGVLLPSLLRGLGGRRYFKIQYRFNRFYVSVPITTQPIPPILAQRFQLQQEMKDYNRRNLPNFATLASSLDVL